MLIRSYVRKTLRALLVALPFLALPAFAQVPVGYVQVYGNYVGGQTSPEANGTIYFQPVNTSGTPIGYRVAQGYSAVVNATWSSSAITGCTVSAGGIGYTAGATAVVSSTYGSGGAISLTVVSGVITGCTVTSGGSYTAAPAVTVVGYAQATQGTLQAQVTNGVFSLLVPDTAMTSPQNVCYNVTVTDNVSGNSILGPGYTCVQPAGSGLAVIGSQAWCQAASTSVGGTCAFDAYTPNLAALAFTQAGPVPTLTGASATALPFGSAPTAVVNGTNPYSFGFGIPAGAPGATGPAGANGNISGPWSSATAYTVGATITNNGNLYYALSANTNQTPPTTCTSNTYWQNAVCNVGVSGLSSDSNSGTITTGSAQVGTLYKTYKCVGADPTDGNAINAMLANGSGVYLTLLGACVDNTVVINIQSNQTIDGGRAASITFAPIVANLPSPIWTGYLQNVDANESATRTFSDGVTTANSTSLTSASGAAFVAGDVGQGISCTGVLGSSVTEVGVTIPNQLTTTIRSVVSATQIETVDPIPVGATSVSCSIYYRDSHITLKGLKIVNNGPGCANGTNDNWWITVFTHVSGLVLQNVDFQNGTTGQSSTAGCKQMLVSDASNIRIIDSSALTWGIFSDGYDFFGNVSDVKIDGQHGHTGDDMVAVQSTTNGFLTGFPVQGAMHNFQVMNGNYGSGTGMLKTYGPDQIGYLPINNISMVNDQCVQTAPGLTSTTGSNAVHGLIVIGGTQDNIKVDGLGGNCGNPIQLNGTIYHGTFSNISMDYTALNSGSNIVQDVANANQAAPIYGDLSFDHIHFNGGALPASAIKFTDTGAIIGSFKLDDFQVTNYYSTNASLPLVAINASSLGIFNARNLGVQFVTGSTQNNALIYLGPPSSGGSQTMALGQANISDSYIHADSGTVAAFPLLELINISTSPLVSFKSVSLVSSTSSTVGSLIGVFSQGTPSSLGTPSFLIQNSILSNVSSCFERFANSDGNSTAFAQNYNGITSLGNSFSVATATSCPNANQFGPTNLVGANTVVGATTAYDKVTLAGITAANVGTLTQAATGGGGSLTDNTTFFYKVCSVNSVGANCSSEHSILVCSSSTCSNLSTVTIPLATQALGAQTYNVYRSTTTGTELLCGSLTAQPSYVSSIVDQGSACSGAAVPTSNTSFPTLVVPNTSGSQNTTINGSASSSAVTAAMPSTTGTLAITSQLSPIRAGSWTISGSTTATITFGTAMTNTPANCALTPGSSASATGTPFATALATTGFTVNVPTSGTISGTYSCSLNNTD